MTPLDNEYLEAEGKATAIKLRKTTANLVRHFMQPALQLKLKATFGESRSSEYAGLIESFNDIKSLWSIKLTTPLEELNSIKEQLKILQLRTQKLRENRDQKKDQLQKYLEQSKENKEQGESEIKQLQTTIGQSNTDKERELRELNEISKVNHEALSKQHTEEVTSLKKKIDQLEKMQAEVKNKNKLDETKLREDYKKASTLYTENLNIYDQDMKEQTRSKQTATEQFDSSHNELVLVNEEYKFRLEERKQREEILAIMKKKNDEQSKQMNLLNKAAEWMQAHWRGLLARREMEKARKGKKKKKKK